LKNLVAVEDIFCIPWKTISDDIETSAKESYYELQGLQEPTETNGDN
jgi:hypothetical protein